MDESIFIALEGLKSVSLVCKDLITANVGDDGDRCIFLTCADIEQSCLHWLAPDENIDSLNESDAPTDSKATSGKGLNLLSLVRSRGGLKSSSASGGQNTSSTSDEVNLHSDSVTNDPDEENTSGTLEDYTRIVDESIIPYAASLNTGLHQGITKAHMCAITDIIVLHDNDPVPEGFTKITQSISGIYSADLSAASGSRQLWLAVARFPSSPAITSLQLVSVDQGEFVPPSFTPVRRHSTGRAADFHFGQQNSQLVLCYTRAIGSPIIDIGIIFPFGGIPINPVSIFQRGKPDPTTPAANERLPLVGTAAKSISQPSQRSGLLGLTTEVAAKVVSKFQPTKEDLPHTYVALTHTLLGAEVALFGGSVRGRAYFCCSKDMTHIDALEGCGNREYQQKFMNSSSIFPSCILPVVSKISGSTNGTVEGRASRTGSVETQNISSTSQVLQAIGIARSKSKKIDDSQSNSASKPEFGEFAEDVAIRRIALLTNGSSSSVVIPILTARSRALNALSLHENAFRSSYAINARHSVYAEASEAVGLLRMLVSESTDSADPSSPDPSVLSRLSGFLFRSGSSPSTPGLSGSVSTPQFTGVNSNNSNSESRGTERRNDVTDSGHMARFMLDDLTTDDTAGVRSNNNEVGKMNHEPDHPLLTAAVEFMPQPLLPAVIGLETPWYNSDTSQFGDMSEEKYAEEFLMYRHSAWIYSPATYRMRVEAERLHSLSPVSATSSSSAYATAVGSSDNIRVSSPRVAEANDTTLLSAPRTPQPSERRARQFNGRLVLGLPTVARSRTAAASYRDSPEQGAREPIMSTAVPSGTQYMSSKLGMMHSSGTTITTNSNSITNKPVPTSPVPGHRHTESDTRVAGFAGSLHANSANFSAFLQPSAASMLLAPLLRALYSRVPLLVSTALDALAAVVRSGFFLRSLGRSFSLAASDAPEAGELIDDFLSAFRYSEADTNSKTHEGRSKPHPVLPVRDFCPSQSNPPPGTLNPKFGPLGVSPDAARREAAYAHSCAWNLLDVVVACAVDAALPLMDHVSPSLLSLLFATQRFARLPISVPALVAAGRTPPDSFMLRPALTNALAFAGQMSIAKAGGLKSEESDKKSRLLPSEKAARKVTPASLLDLLQQIENDSVSNVKETAVEHNMDKSKKTLFSPSSTSNSNTPATTERPILVTVPISPPVGLHPVTLSRILSAAMTANCLAHQKCSYAERAERFCTSAGKTDDSLGFERRYVLGRKQAAMLLAFLRASVREFVKNVERDFTSFSAVSSSYLDAVSELRAASWDPATANTTSASSLAGGNVSEKTTSLGMGLLRKAKHMMQDSSDRRVVPSASSGGTSFVGYASLEARLSAERLPTPEPFHSSNSTVSSFIGESSSTGLGAFSGSCVDPVFADDSPSLQQLHQVFSSHLTGSASLCAEIHVATHPYLVPRMSPSVVLPVDAAPLHDQLSLPKRSAVADFCVLLAFLSKVAAEPTQFPVNGSTSTSVSRRVTTLLLRDTALDLLREAFTAAASGPAQALAASPLIRHTISRLVIPSLLSFASSPRLLHPCISIVFCPPMQPCPFTPEPVEHPHGVEGSAAAYGSSAAVTPSLGQKYRWYFTRQQEAVDPDGLGSVHAPSLPVPPMPLDPEVRAVLLPAHPFGGSGDMVTGGSVELAPVSVLGAVLAVLGALWSGEDASGNEGTARPLFRMLQQERASTLLCPQLLVPGAKLFIDSSVPASLLPLLGSVALLPLGRPALRLFPDGGYDVLNVKPIRIHLGTEIAAAFHVLVLPVLRPAGPGPRRALARRAVVAALRELWARPQGFLEFFRIFNKANLGPVTSTDSSEKAEEEAEEYLARSSETGLIQPHLRVLRPLLASLVAIAAPPKPIDFSNPPSNPLSAGAAAPAAPQHPLEPLHGFPLAPALLEPSLGPCAVPSEVPAGPLQVLSLAQFERLELATSATEVLLQVCRSLMDSAATSVMVSPAEVEEEAAGDFFTRKFISHHLAKGGKFPSMDILPLPAHAREAFLRGRELRHEAMRLANLESAFFAASAVGLQKGFTKALLALRARGFPCRSLVDTVSVFRLSGSLIASAADRGDFLGDEGRGPQNKRINAAIRKLLFAGVSFASMPFDVALRVMLTRCGFRLPGESQKIGRIASAFAEAYFEDNRAALLSMLIAEEEMQRQPKQNEHSNDRESMVQSRVSDVASNADRVATSESSTTINNDEFPSVPIVDSMSTTPSNEELKATSKSQRNGSQSNIHSLSHSRNLSGSAMQLNSPGFDGHRVRGESTFSIGDLEREETEDTSGDTFDIDLTSGSRTVAGSTGISGASESDLHMVQSVVLEEEEEEIEDDRKQISSVVESSKNLEEKLSNSADKVARSLRYDVAESDADNEAIHSDSTLSSDADEDSESVTPESNPNNLSLRDITNLDESLEDDDDGAAFSPSHVTHTGRITSVSLSHSLSNSSVMGAPDNGYIPASSVESAELSGDSVFTPTVLASTSASGLDDSSTVAVSSQVITNPPAHISTSTTTITTTTTTTTTTTVTTTTTSATSSIPGNALASVEARLPKHSAAAPDGRLFPASPDVVEILAFSCIMLNTDAHNTNIKKEKRMTKKQFVSNNRGIDGGKDLPAEFLEFLYNSISTNEIKMNIPSAQALVAAAGAAAAAAASNISQTAAAANNGLGAGPLMDLASVTSSGATPEIELLSRDLGILPVIGVPSPTYLPSFPGFLSASTTTATSITTSTTTTTSMNVEVGGLNVSANAPNVTGAVFHTLGLPSATLSVAPTTSVLPFDLPLSGPIAGGYNGNQSTMEDAKALLADTTAQGFAFQQFLLLRSKHEDGLLQSTIQTAFDSSNDLLETDNEKSKDLAVANSSTVSNTPSTSSKRVGNEKLMRLLPEPNLLSLTSTTLLLEEVWPHARAFLTLHLGLPSVPASALAADAVTAGFLDSSLLQGLLSSLPSGDAHPLLNTPSIADSSASHAALPTPTPSGTLSKTKSFVGFSLPSGGGFMPRRRAGTQTSVVASVAPSDTTQSLLSLASAMQTAQMLPQARLPSLLSAPRDSRLAAIDMLKYLLSCALFVFQRSVVAESALMLLMLEAAVLGQQQARADAAAGSSGSVSGISPGSHRSDFVDAQVVEEDDENEEEDSFSPARGWFRRTLAILKAHPLLVDTSDSGPTGGVPVLRHRLPLPSPADIATLISAVHVLCGDLSQQSSQLDESDTLVSTAARFRGEVARVLLENAEQVGRRLLTEGDLVKVASAGRGKHTVYRFFLFTDLLLYAQKSSFSDKYSTHQVIPLAGTRIISDPPELMQPPAGSKDNASVAQRIRKGTSFKLETSVKPLFIICSDVDEATDWKRRIREATTALEMAHGSNDTNSLQEKEKAKEKVVPVKLVNSSTPSVSSPGASQSPSRKSSSSSTTKQSSYFSRNNMEPVIVAKPPVVPTKTAPPAVPTVTSPSASHDNSSVNHPEVPTTSTTIAMDYLKHNASLSPVESTPIATDSPRTKSLSTVPGISNKSATSSTVVNSSLVNTPVETAQPFVSAEISASSGTDVVDKVRPGKYENLSELKVAFLKAVAYCKPLLSPDNVNSSLVNANSLGINLSDHEKLLFYGLFKQATLGDCPITNDEIDDKNAPSMPSTNTEENSSVARAKKTAWANHRGLRKRDAMREFVQLLDKLVPNHNQY